MDEIGFAWSVHDGDWDSIFTKLAEYLRPMHNGKPRNIAMSVETLCNGCSRSDNLRNGASLSQNANGFAFWLKLAPFLKLSLR